jgi:hypothetical protein
LHLAWENVGMPPELQMLQKNGDDMAGAEPQGTNIPK